MGLMIAPLIRILTYVGIFLPQIVGVIRRFQSYLQVGGVEAPV